MFYGVTGKFSLAMVFFMFGILVCASLDADEGNAPGLAKALEQVKLFEAMTDADRDTLKAAATLRLARKGERIIEQGTTLTKMFIIMGGQAEVRVDGKHLLVLRGQPLVGEIEFLDRLPASADVILLSETEIIELDNAVLTDIMDQNPRLGYVLMRELARIESRRLRDSSRR